MAEADRYPLPANKKVKTPNRRSRSGCLPCRKRRRKCEYCRGACLAPRAQPPFSRATLKPDNTGDGARPRCRGCQVRNDVCNWGLRVSFHSSRSLELSKEDTAALSAIEKLRQEDEVNDETNYENNSKSSVLKIVDDTEDIVGFFHQQHSQESYTEDSDTQEPHSDQVSFPFGTNPGPPGASSNAQERNGRSRCLNRTCSSRVSTSPDDIPEQFSAFHSGLSPIELSLGHGENDPIRDPFAAPFFLGQAVSRDVSPSPEPQFPFPQQERIELISAYLRETATWCETTDSETNFSVKYAHPMMASTPYVAAAMSLASRQRDAVQRQSNPMTLELYQHAIRLLLRHDPNQADASILATCTVLCVYEMMASGVTEWRRHLRGCAGLLRTHSWNGNSEGIVKTCFWAFARIDVWAAFIIDQNTLIPTDSWVLDDSLECAAAKESIDDYCNLAILMFAKTINLLNTARRETAYTESDVSGLANKAWNELQQWRQLRPRSAQALLRDEPSNRNPFPTIIHTQASAICGNTFYHAGCILLLRSGRIRGVAIVYDEDLMDPVWHARELGGISMSNSSHANWVNHLQPLYIAGQVFGDTGPQALSSCEASGPGNVDDSLSPRRQQPGSAAKGGAAPYGDGCAGTSISGNGKRAEKNEECAAEKVALLKHLAKIERVTGWKTSDRARDLRLLWGLEF